MKQLEIDYFFPLTQQIQLDLDYKESFAFVQQKRKTENTIYTYTNIDTNGLTMNATRLSSYCQIDIDEVPITILSAKKPNVIKRWLYTLLGVRWEVK